MTDLDLHELNPNLCLSPARLYRRTIYPLYETVTIDKLYSCIYARIYVCIYVCIDAALKLLT